MHGRQDALERFVSAIVIFPLHVDFQETVEFNHFACGGEMLGARGWGNVDSGLLDFGIGHLGSQCALPDQ